MLGELNMDNCNIIAIMLQDNLSSSDCIVDCLYVTTNPCRRNMLLNRLRKNLANISLLSQGLQRSENMTMRMPDVSPEPTRIFTQAQLEKFNGKNGNPAYVAVNGLVYDITNIAAWGGAMHFGLPAGKVYTREFNICHEGQSILDRLTVVGKMVE